MKPHDTIKLVLASIGRDGRTLLWNLTFYDLRYIELAYSRRRLRLCFSDGSEHVVFFDDYGYPLESALLHYSNRVPVDLTAVKYSYCSAPTEKVCLPSPFHYPLSVLYETGKSTNQENRRF